MLGQLENLPSTLSLIQDLLVVAPPVNIDKYENVLPRLWVNIEDHQYKLQALNNRLVAFSATVAQYVRRVMEAAASAETQVLALRRGNDTLSASATARGGGTEASTTDVSVKSDDMD